MYKLNFYPEHEEAQRDKRRRVALTALLSSFLGLSGVLIAALAISGFLLQERVKSLRAQHADLTARVQAGNQEAGQGNPAEQLLKLRAARIDWAPKIAAVSRAIPDDLILDEILGESEWKRTPRRLEMLGTVRRSDPNVDAVSAFVERLKADPSVSADFADVGVGYIKSSGSFRVICRNPEAEQ